MQTLKSTPFLEGLVFPEGPRWHDGKLWFSDIWGHKVMTVDGWAQTKVIAEVPEKPSGLGFLADGQLLIVSMENSQLLRLDPDGLQTVADLSSLAAGGINDMVVDAQGRAYVGGYDSVGETMPGKVMLVHPDGSARVVAEELAAPNGAVITPDGKTYIVAETRGRALTAFRIMPDGSLRDRRTFAQFERSVPDGICLDGEGAVWVGSFSKSEFLRVKEGGEVTHRIPTPGKWSVACMLGGEDRRTLFLMTAVTTMEELTRYGRAVGSIETVRVEVPGAGWP